MKPEKVNSPHGHRWETYPTWYPRGKDQDIGKEWKKGVTKLDEGMVENKTVD